MFHVLTIVLIRSWRRTRRTGTLRAGATELTWARNPFLYPAYYILLISITHLSGLAALGLDVALVLGLLRSG